MHERMDGLADSRISNSAAQTCTREPALLPLLLILFHSLSTPPSPHSVALRPNAGQGLPIQRFADNTQRRATVGKTPLDE